MFKSSLFFEEAKERSRVFFELTLGCRPSVQAGGYDARVRENVEHLEELKEEAARPSKPVAHRRTPTTKRAAENAPPALRAFHLRSRSCVLPRATRP